jgi:hypothetical protein
VKVHFLTLSCTLGSRRCASRVSLLSRPLASPYFGRKPKVRVVIKELTKPIWAKCIPKGMFIKANIGDYDNVYENTQMCAYCDANWVGNMHDRKSTSSYVFLSRNGVVDWNSKN